MFEPSDTPRVFALAPGVDFPAALVSGLLKRFEGQPPEALARVELIVNTRRMTRRIRSIFDQGPALLLPQLRLVTDLGEASDTHAIAPAVSPLRRRLELVQLVSSLLDQAPELAPRSSLYDLADSLATLMDEMQGEGVSPDAIRQLDVSDQSGHWERAQKFLGIVQGYFDEDNNAPDAEARQRMVVENLIERWKETPPKHPVIIAGSTGSRGSTMKLMRAVAQLPQGAIVLPGFDDVMPAALWDTMENALLSEDHPQYRFRRIMELLEIGRDDVESWHSDPPPNEARNRLISLALRPAPVTDQWLLDGPKLDDIEGATREITLLEADTPRAEALAIAMRLRKSVEDGQAAALITPDRLLTRQVTAALDQWDILPDDSAGMPLQLSAVGRLLRHIAALFQNRLTAESLLTLLKHPLTHSGSDRGTHQLLTHELELHLRRKGPPYPVEADLRQWADLQKNTNAVPWVDWLVHCFTAQVLEGPVALPDRLARHLEIAEEIVRGSDPDASSELWVRSDGQEAKRVINELSDAADAGGDMTAADYGDLFGAVLNSGEVRQSYEPHPNVLIWGTLEARVQGADLVILAGLNEGSWPEAPKPDPWLNRKMRHEAGLLLPERRIGLSAHDFQQAIGAREVWLTRSRRSDDAETVASRWLNRITNLLDGLPSAGGNTALIEMRARGKSWLDYARKFEEPLEIAPAPRPAPSPPKESRPKRLSVTEIKRLSRDPYAIYAKHILRLRPLDPLMREPDALARGIVIHTVIERFIEETEAAPDTRTKAKLLQVAEDVFEREIPWPAARLMWLARVERFADWFLVTEEQRRQIASPAAFETRGELTFEDLGFTLSAQADRIDRDADGRLHIYDYKTGKPPTMSQQIQHDNQLLLEAVIAENAGFGSLPATPVARAIFIGLGNPPIETAAPLDKEPVEKLRADFHALISGYLSGETSYTARRAMLKKDDISDYDQLSRFGEWNLSDLAERMVLT